MAYLIILIALVILIGIGMIILIIITSNEAEKQNRYARNAKEQKTLEDLTNQGINATRSFFKKIFFDDDSKRLAKVDSDGTLNCYDYSDILDFKIEAHTTTKTYTQGGLSGAVVGGALFGGIGAIVGASTASSTSINMITAYTITIYFKDGISDGFSIDRDELGAIFYQEYQNLQFHNLDGDVNELNAILLNIAKSNALLLETKPETSELSPADEIAKYKKLLDDGAISFEEYEEKKQQLLKS